MRPKIQSALDMDYFWLLSVCFFADLSFFSQVANHVGRYCKYTNPASV